MEELVEEVKELWLLCLRHRIQLHPAWLSREELMMKRVDVLSKVGTVWVLQQSFVEEVLTKTGLLPMAPDVARCGPTIAAVVRRKVRTILVLPRWEAQSWWQAVVKFSSKMTEAPHPSEMFYPNSQGLPRWVFCLCVFDTTDLMLA